MEEERKAFFGGWKKRGHIVRFSQEHLVVIKDEKVYHFVKFEIILSFPCCLVDPIPIKHYRARSTMINLWIDSRTCHKYRILLSATQNFNNYF